MADIVFLTFFPTIVAGLVCAAAWRLVPKGRSRTTLQVIGSLLFFVPQLAVIIVGGQSIHLVLHREAIIALWLLGIAALALWRTVRALMGNPVPDYAVRSRQIHNPVFLAAVGVGFAFVGFGLGSEFLRDVFQPRIPIEGDVSKKWIYYGRAGAHWYVMVDGRTFEVTRDVYAGLRPHEAIRAELGAGSHAVLKVDRR